MKSNSLRAYLSRIPIFSQLPHFSDGSGNRHSTHRGLVMKSRILKRSRIVAMLFLVILLVMGLADRSQAQNPPNWQVGDIVVCFGTGKCNVLRNTNSGLVLISQVSDGFTGAGATNGAAINNTLHLLMTDAGATGTTNGSNIVEYTIANVDPFTGGEIGRAHV